jgi:heme oxygenase
MAQGAALDKAAMRLADQLKDATGDVHRQAERGGAVALLLRGTLTLQAYARLLANLRPAYQALEAGLLQWREHPALRAVVRPELFRAAALEADLVALVGEDWASRVAVLPAGRAYVARREALRRDDPMLLLAHAYVRYLGDLNGGQVLARRLAGSLGLGAAALGFYRFEAIGTIETFREEYRRGFDQAALTPPQTQAVLAEARRGFMLTMAISQAVAADGAGEG